MNFELGDTVKIKNSGPEVFKITQASSDGPRYLLQLGNDGAAIQWRNEEEIELVAKVKKPDYGPGFVLERGIMG
jgi:uncharacterized protein YodC (DUF2158 family)